jgi:hypothetical protein
MNAPTTDIKDYLTGISSLGLVFAENLFIAKEPSAPHECVTLYDYAGAPPLATMEKLDNIYEHCNIQIRVRSDSYVDGYRWIHSIFSHLHNVGQTTINGTLYTSILAKQSPFVLEWDNNDRAVFIVNFSIQRR